MTATSKRVLRLLEQRDGRRCGWCGREGDTLVPHHRANRGMGGAPDRDTISNLIWLCADENGLIESDERWAERARADGVKISRHSEPSAVPIRHWLFGWVLLNDEGTATPAPTI